MITIDNWMGGSAPMLSLMSCTGGSYFDNLEKSLKVIDIIGNISQNQIKIIGYNKISIKNQNSSNYYSLHMIKISDIIDVLH